MQINTAKSTLPFSLLLYTVNSFLFFSVKKLLLNSHHHSIDRVEGRKGGIRELGDLMEKTFTLLQTVGAAGVFSAVSFWYGFMFGRESSRKQLGSLIDDLRKANPNESTPPPPPPRDS